MLSNTVKRIGIKTKDNFFSSIFSIFLVRYKKAYFKEETSVKDLINAIRAVFS